MSSAYQQTLDWLYAQLPMFSRVGKAALKPSLSNTLRLCEALGQPQDRFKSIHIAGTNGKGSTSHMLAAVLQQAGFKTGLYTSPHMTDFRERIRINGQMVAEAFVADFVRRHQDVITEIKPSFFEITVAMAFEAFAQAGVDYAVIETGLGGRLDSTNIISPVLSIITNISLDHTDLLGNTPEAIAREKAGIIKAGVPVLIGQQQEEVQHVFFEQSVLRHSTLYEAETFWELVRTGQDSRYQYFKAVDKAGRRILPLQTDLLGQYQQHNIKTVLSAVDILRATEGLRLEEAGVLNALGRVQELTGLRGRWDWLRQQPIVIADVAHNPAGLQEVMVQWQLVDARQKHIVVGFVRDKDVTEALGLLPRGQQMHYCHAQIPRALPAEELQALAAELGRPGRVYASVADAVRGALREMSPEDALLVVGSFFIAGEAMQALEEI